MTPSQNITTEDHLLELPSDERQASLATMQKMHEHEERLRNLRPVILDLSIREPAVGIPRGHTVENKLALWELARQAGFRDILLATFNVSLPEEPQVDDLFVKELRRRHTDLTGCFAFVGVGKFVGDAFEPHISMEKLESYGIPNAIFDVDIASWNLDGDTREQFVARLLASIAWLTQHLDGDGGQAPRIYVNYQDGVDAFFEKWGMGRPAHPRAGRTAGGGGRHLRGRQGDGVPVPDRRLDHADAPIPP